MHTQLETAMMRVRKGLVCLPAAYGGQQSEAKKQ